MRKSISIPLEVHRQDQKYVEHSPLLEVLPKHWDHLLPKCIHSATFQIAKHRNNKTFVLVCQLEDSPSEKLEKVLLNEV